MSVFSRMSGASYRCGITYMRQANQLLKPSTDSHTTIRFFRQKNSPVSNKPDVKPGKETVVRERDVRTKVDPEADRPILHYVAYTAAFVPCVVFGGMWFQYNHIRDRLQETRKRGTLFPMPQKVKEGSEGFIGVWNRFPPFMKIGYGIIGMNAAVFLMWRANRLLPMMMRYFMLRPVRGNSIFATTLSAFSHENFVHMFVNMYVLLSFVNPAYFMLGPEQFISFYLGAGTFSAMVSCIFKRFRGTSVASVGASGAIMALLGLVCTVLPETRLQLAFVHEIFPHSFSAENGLIAIILLDVVGLIRGWKRLDHAGHLGGVLFGVLYAKFGRDWWTSIRKKVFKFRKFIGGKASE